MSMSAKIKRIANDMASIVTTHAMNLREHLQLQPNLTLSTFDPKQFEEILHTILRFSNSSNEVYFYRNLNPVLFSTNIGIASSINYLIRVRCNFMLAQYKNNRNIRLILCYNRSAFVVALRSVFKFSVA